MQFFVGIVFSGLPCQIKWMTAKSVEPWLRYMYKTRDLSCSILMGSFCSLPPKCASYVKHLHVIMLSGRFLQAKGKECRRHRALRTLGSLFDFEKFRKTSSSHTLAWAAAACERFEADTDSIHQPLHLCLMALRRHSCLPVCLVCTYHMPTYTFMSENQQAAQRQGAQMDFLIQLFAGSLFSSSGFWSPSQKRT